MYPYSKENIASYLLNTSNDEKRRLRNNVRKDEKVAAYLTSKILQMKMTGHVLTKVGPIESVEAAELTSKGSLTIVRKGNVTFQSVFPCVH